MAIPPTAATFADALDPMEEMDFVYPAGPLLEEGEEIASYTLALRPEAIALGLTIMTGGGRDPALIEGSTAILFWLAIDDDFKTDAAFDGTGTSLPMEVTFVTNSAPARTRQRTILVRVVQQ
ncbi:hypothetical protein [Novosphingobium album (ex Liu et al. 2023)]|uniref:DUF3168 domain-containing protein n=1 Tax=Novosphingobium album (ex Liu et al. 2023) TaxID=3031130 RepID=A0ABT5WXX9_9SPHN|nr:hypothetical protein [Novosphingobium album (ex Liu et al. 2023)]MDE8654768.1 hypothetical protein [Novosphingobium album (ex Liu et al. 2023)]